MKLEKGRNDRITDPMYADNPIPIPINIGRFDSGYFPSAVPDRAIIEGRYGIAPGETIDAAKQEFMQCMATLTKSTVGLPSTLYKWNGLDCAYRQVVLI